MFSSDSINRFRGLMAKSFTETCTIERERDVRGQFGDREHSWELVADGVACRIIQGGEDNSSGSRLSGDREVIEEEYRLILPWGTDVGADYRVTVNGATYLVVRVERALSDDVMTQALMVRDNG